ncbi:ABC transporter ATP-binding protein [Azospirillum halopraeferens]|uniref:ABC transporter ATP-binding protein n=1 Tax=Azospirillum halopraeferens TaxID=34010 RepID=UPI000413E1A0|nr:ABC transporter ATP-binding protein [Azospirillum halopraeferens]
MSSDTAIRVSGLSKRHQLYNQPLDRLRQRFARDGARHYKEVVALDGLDFEVRRGETVGVVGRNGSGKSTLLQILSGTLRPTAGRAEIHGRVSALLELGAGFNGDFTGRENVYMNAAIIGLTREEIDARIERIIAFADIGDFIDQPVRVYSSGMYIRLAFSLAISVDPDILIVDEALAVGDEAFQAKCFARIKEFQKQGGTLLFVSHDAGAVLQFCNRALLLDSGRLILSGKPKTVITQYQRLLYAPMEQRDAMLQEIAEIQAMEDASAEGTAAAQRAEPASAERAVTVAAAPAEGAALYDPNLVSKGRLEYPPNGARILDPRIETPEGERVNVLRRGREYVFRYAVAFDADADQVLWLMVFRTLQGYALGGQGSHRLSRYEPHVPAGTVAEVSFRFTCRLFGGTYLTNCGVTASHYGERQYLHRVIDAVMFRVEVEPDMPSGGHVDFGLEPAVTFRRAEVARAG